MSRIFIFGYGSLISEDSRRRTGNTSKALVASVPGLSRGWFIRNNDFFYASVAVVEDTSTHCNGVVFEVDADMLLQFDKREYGYKRVSIDPERVETAEPVLSENDAVYTYVVEKVETPDSARPIPLSYVDVIMQGCLEISEEFTEEFVALTSSWDSTWLNDIDNPIYVRPLGGTVDREQLQAFYLQRLLEEKEVSRVDYLDARLELSDGLL